MDRSGVLCDAQAQNTREVRSAGTQTVNLRLLRHKGCIWPTTDRALLFNASLS